MQSDIVFERVSHVIDLLNEIDIDGETMEYILWRVNMREQMLRQLVLEADPAVLQELIEEREILKEQQNDNE